jgi:hypothetical protein
MQARLTSVALSALCLAACLALSGCSVWNAVFHKSRDHGCSQKPFQGNTVNLPGLQVPEGMTPPDPRNQVRIPSLSEPERMRARTEPCLSQPPSYASGSSIALPTRTGLPMGAPAPAPVPVSPTAPVVPLPEPETVPGPIAPATPEPPATPAPPEPPVPDGPR